MVEAGESHKTLDTAEKIYDKLLECNADRNTLLIGVGGGVITDLAGFIGSTFMRGMPFAFIPTSLIAQADAAIGGKNGVNFNAYKNLVGCIQQPHTILVDTRFLKTLSDADFKNGLAEILKYALIADESLMKYMEMNVRNIRDRVPEVMNKLVKDSIKIKMQYIRADEKDLGLRRQLNFGHTLGHAIERQQNILHGLAVAKGMVAAMHFSVDTAGFDKNDMNRVIALMKAFGLPFEFRWNDTLKYYMSKDKKKQGADIDFALLHEIGNAYIESIPLSELHEYFKRHTD